MSKRLELIWPNKDKVLLGLEGNGKPIWGSKDDLESRLLVQLEAVGETNPDNLDDLYEQGDNLLIKGDNLLTLKALERHFAGKIKCIYIDPPFNTGNAFEHYDDGLEHTIWLSMMKSRLEILRKLLREDGAIFVEIDDGESKKIESLWRRQLAIATPMKFLSMVMPFIQGGIR
jgi:adenine specific DNA methylase Mod